MPAIPSRLAGMWLPTGGHVDPGELPHIAAQRELTEELRIVPKPHQALGDVPAMVTVTTTAGQHQHTDVSLWYVFDHPDDTELHPDPREFTAVKWWPFDEVKHGPNTRFEPHLPRFLAKLAAITSNDSLRKSGD